MLPCQTRATSPCGDGKCTDQATSVVQVDNSTLQYCYTNNKSPEPFTATLLPNNTYGKQLDNAIMDFLVSKFVQT